ncbi:hypothetical protein JXJ21_01845 [candidate division KSB1 bacterium]|nr:hypothetical protein [candidate division KSB1 bacterium]
MITRIAILVFVSFFCTFIFAQEEMPDTFNDDTRDRVTTEGMVQATEFSVPSSPAFTLLGANPSKVSKPGFAKDFKVDAIIKNKKLVSDMALELQPVWLIGYRNKSLHDYQKQHFALRSLSTLNLSIATADKDSIKYLAYSIKLSLYRQNDPMTDSSYVAGIRKSLEFSDVERRTSLRLEVMLDDVEDLNNQLKNPQLSPSERRQKQKTADSLAIAIEEHKIVLAKIDESINSQLKVFRESYIKRTWNSAMLDVGVGKIHSYINPSLDSLVMEDKGFGVWLNGSVGIGKSILLSSLVKYIKWEHINTQTVGGNLRYGDSKSNFFVEYVYEKVGDINRNLISYGGEYRIDQKKALEFSLATEYTKKFKLKNLIPQVRVNWNVAKDLLK